MNALASLAKRLPKQRCDHSEDNAKHPFKDSQLSVDFVKSSLVIGKGTGSSTRFSLVSTSGQKRVIDLRNHYSHSQLLKNNHACILAKPRYNNSTAQKTRLGFSSPDRGAVSAAPSLDSGFFIASMDSDLAGHVGSRKARCSSDSLLTRMSCLPRLVASETGSKTCSKGFSNTRLLQNTVRSIPFVARKRNAKVFVGNGAKPNLVTTFALTGNDATVFSQNLGELEMQR